MFFIGIFGIDRAQKEIAVQNNVTCVACGRMTRYRVSKTYNYFHVFFIPTFRWHIRYFVQADDCGHVFELDQEIGRQFQSGGNPFIRPEQLSPLGGTSDSLPQTCSYCGQEMASTFRYCPYCGKKLH